MIAIKLTFNGSMGGGVAHLGAHEDEAKGVDGPDQGVQDPGVPAAVRLIHQRVDRIADHERVQHIAQVPHRLGVILLGLGLPAPVSHHFLTLAYSFSLPEKKCKAQPAPSLQACTED